MLDRVLVTGGAGFIGSSLVRALVERGERVRVLDDFSTGYRENLADVASVELIEGDVRDDAALDRALTGVEVVFHQAAIPSVPRSVANPFASHDVNATGTLKLLQAARRAAVRRVVYASSSSVYGDSASLPKVETMPTDPRSPYAVSKLTGEHYCRAFFQVYGLETVSLRYFNVFGPRQDPRSEYAAVMPRFVAAALAGAAVVVHGDGEQSRDFCFIDNVVSANLLAATTPAAAGRVFNVACGQAISLNQVLALLEEMVGAPIGRDAAGARAGDVRHSLADIGAARAVLRYRPLVDVAEGLGRLVDWTREYRRAPGAKRADR